MCNIILCYNAYTMIYRAIWRNLPEKANWQGFSNYWSTGRYRKCDIARLKYLNTRVLISIIIFFFIYFIYEIFRRQRKNTFYFFTLVHSCFNNLLFICNVVFFLKKNFWHGLCNRFINEIIIYYCVNYYFLLLFLLLLLLYISN